VGHGRPRKRDRYRIYPNEIQKRELARTFGRARWVYNWALEKKSEAHSQLVFGSRLFRRLVLGTFDPDSRPDSVDKAPLCFELIVWTEGISLTPSVRDAQSTGHPPRPRIGLRSFLAEVFAKQFEGPPASVQPESPRGTTGQFTQLLLHLLFTGRGKKRASARVPLRREIRRFPPPCRCAPNREPCWDAVRGAVHSGLPGGPTAPLAGWANHFQNGSGFLAHEGLFVTVANIDQLVSLLLRRINLQRLGHKVRTNNSKEDRTAKTTDTERSFCPADSLTIPRSKGMLYQRKCSTERKARPRGMLCRAKVSKACRDRAGNIPEQMPQGRGASGPPASRSLYE
jgi:hypothetical protein